MVASNPGSAQAAFTILARDKAMNVVKDFSAGVQGATRAITTFAGGAAKANAIMGLLAISIPVVTSALASLVLIKTANTMVDFERASRRADLQLQFLNLSAIDAQAAIGSLGGALDRVTATSLFMSKQAIDQVAVAGVGLATELAVAAATLEDKFGIPFREAFNALFQSRVFDNPEPLLAAVGGIERLGITIDEYNNLNGAQLNALLLTMADATVVTNAEKLADSFERIAQITQPGREQVTEFIVGLLNVLVESLAFHLEAGKDVFSEAIINGLLLAFAVAGRGLAPVFAAAFIGFFGTLIVNDIEALFEVLKDDPKVVLPIAAAALAIGFLFGSVLAAVAVLAVSGALLPGLQTAFDDLSTEDQVGLVTLLIGTAIGKRLGLSIIQALGFGALLSKIAGDALKEKGEDGSNFRIIFQLVGFAIGTALTKGIAGGIGGALAGGIVFDVFSNWIIPWGEWFEDTLVAIAKNAGISMVNTFIGTIQIMVGALEAQMNQFINAYNTLVAVYNAGARLIGAPTISKLDPVDFTAPGFIDPVDLPPLPNNGSGSPLPPGFVSPPGNGGGTTTVILVLNEQVIAEVVLNTVTNEVHQRAGVINGAAGV